MNKRATKAQLKALLSLYNRGPELGSGLVN